MSKKKPNLQVQLDSQARSRRICNLRLQVISMAMSQKADKYVLKKMVKAGEEGKREASEIGRKKAQAKEQNEAGG
jgi:hypothetical protein